MSIGTMHPASVFSSIPRIPSGATERGAEEYSSMAGENDNEYTITSGTTLKIQRFIATAEDVLSGNLCELWYDPNGDKTSMTLICPINTNGHRNYYDLDNEFTGDGTARIVMRRRRLAGGISYIYAKWQGYEI